MTLPRIGVLGLVAAGFLLLGWLVRTPMPRVETVSAAVAPLPLSVATNGKIEPIASAEVRARLEGRITFLPEPGTRIEAGEVLLRIDAAQVRGELSSLRSERLAAGESLEAAKRELDRIARRAATDAELFAQGGITPERQRESQALRRAASARVEFLERELPLRLASLDLRAAELESRLEAAELRAPFRGTLYDTNAKLGEAVSIGDLILWFADLEKLRVRTNIDQVDLGVVAVGQVARISSNAYPERRWSARISELIPRIVRKQSRLVAEGLANIESPAEGLVPGMTVDVEIVVDAGLAVLQVPTDSIHTDASGSYVLRVAAGRVERRRVEVGRSSAAKVEIVRGLAAGDSVAIGAADLADGARITLRSDDVR